jgi:polygalacturonase
VIRLSNTICAASLVAMLVAGCGGGGGSPANGSGSGGSPAQGASTPAGTPASTPAVNPPGAGGSTPASTPAVTPPSTAYQVGTTTSDPLLPAAPTLPALPPSPVGAQPCQLMANYATQASGTLSTSIEQTIAGSGAPANNPTAPANPTAPDTARIQAALNACAKAANAYTSANLISSNGIVELSASSGNNAFLSGPLSMPGGVTLVIDSGVTLFASRDPVQYESGSTGAAEPSGVTGLPATPDAASSGVATYNTTAAYNNGTYFCGQIYVNDNGCEPFISNIIYQAGSTNKYYSSNNAIMGPGIIDGQGGQPLYSVQAGNGHYPPLIQRPGGSSAPNMSWWDIGWEGNEAISGADENNPRMIEPYYGYNFVLFNLTIQNAPKFHVTPTAMNGFTAWNVKIFTPTAVYQAMNNYWGAPYSYATVKNTDGIDPGVKSSAVAKNVGSGCTMPAGVLGCYSAADGNFTGDISNVVVAYSYISDSDDNMAVKGESGNASADGAVYNLTVAHNHFYYGHGMSIGSQTAGGSTTGGTPSAGLIANTTPLTYNGQSTYPSVANVNVYDLSLDYTDNGIRIKTNWSEGGLLSNINYTNLCMQGNPSPNPNDPMQQTAVDITPYYTPTANAGDYPSFQNITINGLHELSAAYWVFQGFDTSSSNTYLTGWPTGGTPLPNPAVTYPLGITLNNVVADVSPLSITESDVNALLGLNVNVPLTSSSANNVAISALSPSPPSGASVTVDCSKAFVPFPGQQFP